jgi:hypothetical protein
MVPDMGLRSVGAEQEGDVDQLNLHSPEYSSVLNEKVQTCLGVWRGALNF